MTAIMDRPTTTRIIPAAAPKSRPYLTAVAVYLAVRSVGVAILALLSADNDVPLIDRLTAWDGLWYIRLAEVNYGGMTGSLDAAGNSFPDAPYAFFPLYPMLMSGVAELPGINVIAAGLLVSLAAGIAVAAALVRIARHLDPRPQLGWILAGLFAGAPMAITLSMTYTEALFAALAAWALVGVLERNWLLAAAATLLAGLTRSTALVLIAVVVVAALVAAYRGRDRAAALTAVVAAPLGLAGYWGFVAAQTGSITGWQDIELRGWGVRWDSGAESVEWATRLLLGKGSVFETGTLAVVLGTIILSVLGARRMPWQLTAYGAGVIVLVLGTGGFPFMKARFLLPGMIVLLIPAALGLAGRRPRTAAAVVAGVAIVGGWFSAYGLTAWVSAI